MADTSVAAVNTLSKEATLILYSPLPSPISGLSDSLFTLQLLDASSLNTANGCGLRATHFDSVRRFSLIIGNPFRRCREMQAILAEAVCKVDASIGVNGRYRVALLQAANRSISFRAACLQPGSLFPSGWLTRP